MPEESIPTTRRGRFGPRIGGFPLAVWLVLIALFGGVFGLGSYTFFYAKGASYLSDDAQACANCHVMRDVYDAWSKGSHKSVAVCNDCHTPHTSIAAKYAIKGLNGLKHSTAFTLNNFPEPIQITQMDRDIAQQNCLYCHSNMTALINHRSDKDPIDCIRCHSRVGHDE